MSWGPYEGTGRSLCNINISFQKLANAIGHSVATKIGLGVTIQLFFCGLGARFDIVPGYQEAISYVRRVGTILTCAEAQHKRSMF